jgi:sulfate adenylyltransferase subunit 1
VPISAKHGDNVVHHSARMSWYEGKPLLALLESLPPVPSRRASPFRFPVQFVRRVPLPGGFQHRQYLGRVESGEVRLGDEIAVMPEGKLTRVRALSTADGPLTEASAGKSIAIEVADELDIARGDMFAAPLLPPLVAREFTATLCWFADAPYQGSGRFLVKCGTRSVAARIAALIHRLDLATLATEPNPDTLRCNDIARVDLVLAAPLAFDAYEDNRATGAFILIDEDSNATIAAGMIARAADHPAPPDAGFDAGL